MNEDEILGKVEKSIRAYCTKQYADPAKKKFEAILDGNKDNAIKFFGIDLAMFLIRGIFDYKFSAYQIVLKDPDVGLRGETIVSLMQDNSYSWQLTSCYEKGQ